MYSPSSYRKTTSKPPTARSPYDPIYLNSAFYGSSGSSGSAAAGHSAYSASYSSSGRRRDSEVEPFIPNIPKDNTPPDSTSNTLNTTARHEQWLPGSSSSRRPAHGARPSYGNDSDTPSLAGSTRFRTDAAERPALRHREPSHTTTTTSYSSSSRTRERERERERPAAANPATAERRYESNAEVDSESAVTSTARETTRLRIRDRERDRLLASSALARERRQDPMSSETDGTDVSPILHRKRDGDRTRERSALTRESRREVPSDREASESTAGPSRTTRPEARPLQQYAALSSAVVAARSNSSNGSDVVLRLQQDSGDERLGRKRSHTTTAVELRRDSTSLTAGAIELRRGSEPAVPAAVELRKDNTSSQSSMEAGSDESQKTKDTGITSGRPSPSDARPPVEGLQFGKGMPKQSNVEVDDRHRDYHPKEPTFPRTPPPAPFMMPAMLPNGSQSDLTGKPSPEDVVAALPAPPKKKSSRKRSSTVPQVLAITEKGEEGEQSGPEDANLHAEWPKYLRLPQSPLASQERFATPELRPISVISEDGDIVLWQGPLPEVVPGTPRLNPMTSRSRPISIVSHRFSIRRQDPVDSPKTISSSLDIPPIMEPEKESSPIPPPKDDLPEIQSRPTTPVDQLRVPSPGPQQRAASPQLRRVPSPIPQRAPSPLAPRAASPLAKRSASPLLKRAASPIPPRDPSPVSSRAPSPAPAMLRAPSPAPQRAPSPLPQRIPSPVPARSASPKPARVPSPALLQASVAHASPRPVPPPIPVEEDAPVYFDLKSPSFEKLPLTLSPNAFVDTAKHARLVESLFPPAPPLEAPPPRNASPTPSVKRSKKGEIVAFNKPPPPVVEHPAERAATPPPPDNVPELSESPSPSVSTASPVTHRPFEADYSRHLNRKRASSSSSIMHQGESSVVSQVTFSPALEERPASPAVSLKASVRAGRSQSPVPIPSASPPRPSREEVPPLFPTKEEHPVAAIEPPVEPVREATPPAKVPTEKEKRKLKKSNAKEEKQKALEAAKEEKQKKRVTKKASADSRQKVKESKSKAPEVPKEASKVEETSAPSPDSEDKRTPTVSRTPIYETFKALSTLHTEPEPVPIAALQLAAASSSTSLVPDPALAPPVVPVTARAPSPSRPIPPPPPALAQPAAVVAPTAVETSPEPLVSSSSPRISLRHDDLLAATRYLQPERSTATRKTPTPEPEHQEDFVPHVPVDVQPVEDDDGSIIGQALDMFPLPMGQHVIEANPVVVVKQGRAPITDPGMLQLPRQDSPPTVRERHTRRPSLQVDGFLEGRPISPLHLEPSAALLEAPQEQQRPATRTPSPLPPHVQQPGLTKTPSKESIALPQLQVDKRSEKKPSVSKPPINTTTMPLALRRPSMEKVPVGGKGVSSSMPTQPPPVVPTPRDRSASASTSKPPTTAPTARSEGPQPSTPQVPIAHLPASKHIAALKDTETASPMQTSRVLTAAEEHARATAPRTRFRTHAPKESSSSTTRSHESGMATPSMPTTAMPSSRSQPPTSGRHTSRSAASSSSKPQGTPQINARPPQLPNVDSSASHPTTEKTVNRTPAAEILAALAARDRSANDAAAAMAKERERVRAEQREKERLEREQARERERERRREEERARIEREKAAERERLERERLERLERERHEREQLEREREEKERLERLERERERERERLEREQREREHRERLERERAERLERERLERLERLERERAERLEKERLEKLERERLEQERLERERLERLEKERLEKEQKEREAREQQEREKLEKEQRDRERREQRERRHRAAAAAAAAPPVPVAKPQPPPPRDASPVHNHRHRPSSPNNSSASDIIEFTGTGKPSAPKKSGLFRNIFRRGEDSHRSKPPTVESHGVLHRITSKQSATPPVPTRSSPSPVPQQAPVPTPAPPPPQPEPARRTAASRSGNSSGTDRGKPHPKEKGIISSVNMLFRSRERHPRTVSNASLEAVLGASNNYPNSPAMTNSDVPNSPLPFREPQAAVGVWRDQQAAAQRAKRNRPGVTFADLNSDRGSVAQS